MSNDNTKNTALVSPLLVTALIKDAREDIFTLDNGKDSGMAMFIGVAFETKNDKDSTLPYMFTMDDDKRLVAVKPGLHDESHRIALCVTLYTYGKAGISGGKGLVGVEKHVESKVRFTVFAQSGEDGMVDFIPGAIRYSSNEGFSVTAHYPADVLSLLKLAGMMDYGADHEKQMSRFAANIGKNVARWAKRVGNKNAKANDARKQNAHYTRYQEDKRK